MKAATRLLPAILILMGFFLIRIHLYRLPIADVPHVPNVKSLLGAEDDVPTRVDEDAELASTSALNDKRIQATATVQAQTSTAGPSSTALDQIVVMARTNNDDTSWVNKLPSLVISAARIISYEKC